MVGIEWFAGNWAVIWVLVAVVFGIIEAVTMGLTTIWFCGGAVVAALVAMIGAPLGVQFALFFIVSIVLLYFTRPLAQKKLNIAVEKTNSDALIGHIGFVTVQIDAFSTGQVKIQGKEWTAVSLDRALTIEENTKVVVRSIEGVKLVVEPSADGQQ
ncbi:NfeD family protein [Aminipila butyrica]|uniref:NfeD family protein n=1 Tax=Aminipila butyrica TaxID=433296 RepID=A0A858BW67_9FIRM|nr:NfeD family protein [Aminipila butyrica]QIB69837.1 NfeD family protein [Aminipila butyrica]